jgi:hypothetical protein
MVDALTRPLSRGESLALENHAAACDACADAFRNIDADRAVLEHLSADATRIPVRDNFDAAVLARIARAKNASTPRRARNQSSRMRWAVSALAAAAALAAFLITRPLDDARTRAPAGRPSAELAMNDDDALAANGDDDSLGFGDDAEMATLPETETDERRLADAVFTEVFSGEEIAFLDARTDDATGDDLADEISEMTDEAARGLESSIDAAKKTKSG